MTEKATTGNGSRLRMVVWAGVACLVFLPLVAMQFTDEVDWNLADFIVFGTMLLIACGSYELATRMSSNKAYRAAAAIALATAFILVWMTLAVGIIGNEENAANLMYGGVLAVGLVGALIARFKPIGMAHALLATALAQALVAVIALVNGFGSAFISTGFFVVLWLASARLFRKAAEEQMSAGTAR